MEQGFNFGNVFRNMTKQQKVAAFLFVSIIIILLIVLGVLLSGLQTGSFNENGEWVDDSTSKDDSNDESVVMEKGITGVELKEDSSNIEEDYVEVPVSTEYNEAHDYKLVDYMPSGIYDFISYGDGQSGVRVYWEIVENTAIDNGIVVILDSCDEAGNKKLANDYLKSLDTNLSDYVIVYQTRVGDVPCDAK